MLHVTRWLHKHVWNCRRSPPLSFVTVRSCQQGLMLCGNYQRDWLQSLKVTKQVTGLQKRPAVYKTVAFSRLFELAYSFFFSCAAGLNAFFFFSLCYWYQKFGFPFFWEPVTCNVHTTVLCCVWVLVHIRNSIHSYSSYCPHDHWFLKPVSLPRRNSWTIEPKALCTFKNASENTH